MRAKLIFNLPEETEEFNLALKGSNMKACLEDIAMHIFRPARKHGYPDIKLSELAQDDKVTEAIEILEQKFYSLLEEYEIKIL